MGRWSAHPADVTLTEDRALATRTVGGRRDLRSASSLTGGDGIYGNLNAEAIMRERMERKRFMDAVGRPPRDTETVKDDHPVYAPFIYNHYFFHY